VTQETVPRRHGRERDRVWCSLRESLRHRRRRAPSRPRVHRRCRRAGDDDRERGQRLSGGQRQVWPLRGRSSRTRPSILDEATSALDPAELQQEALGNLMLNPAGSLSSRIGLHDPPRRRDRRCRAGPAYEMGPRRSAGETVRHHAMSTEQLPRDVGRSRMARRQTPDPFRP
jgi:hypothetical protein